jgi:hypothetical protein
MIDRTSTHRFLVGASMVSASLLCAAAARSDESRPDAGVQVDQDPSRPAPSGTAPEPAPARVWYGWQTLIVDAGSVAIWSASFLPPGGSTGNLVLEWGGVIPYVVGAPVVHGFHRRMGTVLGDVALRLALPTVGAFVGGVIASPHCSSGDAFCLADGIIFGLYGGAGVAMALDAAVLAYEKPRPSATSKNVRWGPTVAVDHRGASVGIAGAF